MEKDIDILIIGGNLSGLLSSYIFLEKNINCVIVEKENIDNIINKQNECYLIDNEQNKLMSLVNPSKALDFFHMSLECIYKLNDIINHLDNDCDFFRNPIINFKANKKHNDRFIIFPFIYKLGAFINVKKLMIALLNYYKKYKLLFYDTCHIKNIEINYNNVIVSLNDNIFKCKKILICDLEVSQLYFDLPRGMVKKEYFSFLDRKLNKNIYINSKENIVDYKYYLSPTIKCHVTPFLTEANSKLPFIKIHDYYPQVYFNVNNNDILSSIIGAIILRNNYLELNDNSLKIYDYLYNYGFC